MGFEHPVGAEVKPHTDHPEKVVKADAQVYERSFFVHRMGAAEKFLSAKELAEDNHASGKCETEL